MEGGQIRSEVPSYLGWSIFNTLCCCLPMGIVAIIYSCNVQNANSTGAVANAESASRTAKTLNTIATVLGLIFLIIFIVFKFTLGSNQ